MRTISELIDGLEKYGEREAILAFGKQDKECLSYRDLAKTVERLARALRAHGVEKQDVVPLFATAGLHWIIAAVAIMRVGAVPLPIDVQLDDETLRHILTDSGSRRTLCSSDRRKQLEALDVKDLELLPLNELAESNSETAVDDSWLSAEPADTVVLFYTSGTTAKPKGVPLSHANLAYQVNTIIGERVVTDADRVLLPLPLHHVYPFVIGILTPLALGLPIILPEALTGPQIIRAMREGRATVLIGVPRLYQALVSGILSRVATRAVGARLLFNARFATSHFLRKYLHVRVGRILSRPLHAQLGGSLRMIASGGALLEPELSLQLETLGWEVGIGYGLTETSPLLTVNPPGKARLDTVGRSVEGTELRIEQVETDQRNGRRSDAKHSPGEILASGPGVFSGYLHLPELSRKAFTADGWFRTGDLGYLDRDNYLHIVGRVSTMIKTQGGEKVQPEDLEKLYQENEAVREIGILEDKGRIVALVVPKTSLHAKPQHPGSQREAIKRALEVASRRLPSYQRITDFAITLEPLPRTRLGKIRRQELIEHYRQSRRQTDEETEASRHPIAIDEMSGDDRLLLEDEAARKVWELLAERFHDARLTPDTNLQLELGIDSMEWMNLTLDISQRTGVELEEQLVANVETVRDLLRAVGESFTGAQEFRLEDIFEHPEEFIDTRQSRWLKERNPLEQWIAITGYSANCLLVHKWFGLEVTGLENLPSKPPFVIAPNHSSYLDAVVVAASLPNEQLRDVWWAAWTGVTFANPLLRFISRFAHAVPIDQQHGAKSSLAFGAAILQRGGSLVWFPEGGLSRTGQVQEFRPGLGLLLKYFQVPVVPVLIRGTFEALPLGSRWPRRHKVQVTYGPAADPCEIDHAGEGDRPEQRIMAGLRSRVAALRQ